MTGADAAPVLACAQVPELNVQNGVLKALSFLFEYIGEMGKDYIYAVSPLLEDALMDRDLVHRQTAASVVQVRPAGSQSRVVPVHGKPYARSLCQCALRRAGAGTCTPPTNLCEPVFFYMRTHRQLLGPGPSAWLSENLGVDAQHMALGVAGLGCEDALTHLLNYVWPNIFETSPHVVNAVMGAIDGCRLALGPAIVLNYTLQARGADAAVLTWLQHAASTGLTCACSANYNARMLDALAY